MIPRGCALTIPNIPEIGHFDYRSFDPLNWRSNYPNIAFELHNPGDIYWAAKKVMAFSDEAIRAIVKTGQYSDPRAVEWATRCLIERRNRIGRAAFDAVLPLDNFTVANGRLVFEDLGGEIRLRCPARLHRLMVRIRQSDRRVNSLSPTPRWMCHTPPPSIWRPIFIPPTHAKLSPSISAAAPWLVSIGDGSRGAGPRPALLAHRRVQGSSRVTSST